MSQVTLVVTDPDRRERIAQAIASAGLAWVVVAPEDAPAQGLVLADRPVLTGEDRRLVRHDVRTPLAILLGQCDLLELEPLSERQAKRVETLRRNIDRLEALLDAIAQKVAP